MVQHLDASMAIAIVEQFHIATHGYHVQLKYMSMIKSKNINYLASLLTNIVKLYDFIKTKMSSPFSNGALPLKPSFISFIISNNFCSLFRTHNFLSNDISYPCDEG